MAGVPVAIIGGGLAGRLLAEIVGFLHLPAQVEGHYGRPGP